MCCRIFRSPQEAPSKLVLGAAIGPSNTASLTGEGPSLEAVGRANGLNTRVAQGKSCGTVYAQNGMVEFAADDILAAATCPRLE